MSRHLVSVVHPCVHERLPFRHLTIYLNNGFSPSPLNGLRDFSRFRMCNSTGILILRHWSFPPSGLFPSHLLLPFKMSFELGVVTFITTNIQTFFVYPKFFHIFVKKKYYGNTKFKR